MQATIPAQAWASVVAVVYAAPDESIRLLATGSLFRIADASFVVTAAHAIREAHLYSRTVGISTADNSFVATPGDWIASAETQGPSQRQDPFDVAVYRLSPEMVARLGEVRFLRVTDVSFAAQSPTGMFTLFGFPGLWTQPSRADSEPLTVRPIQFTCFTYRGINADLGDYDARYHVLLDAALDNVTNTDGSPVSLRHSDGRAAKFPNDLRGISGCPVWRIGNYAEPVEAWADNPPLVVGVQTRAYIAAPVLRATGWVAVTTLLHEAFPDLRSAMRVWGA